ncbi:MAG TPA: hypothetical protein VG013_03860 [Gemmataceae bacterium]|jgi:membrane protein implicated in regulation of membrane protease activity|nr:hypothetical protein [Gemmataceae bacterium]
MDTVYLVCATLGGTLLVCQVVLTLLGLGEHHDIGGHEIHVDVHHDVDHDQETSWFVSALSFRALVAAVTFFGLAGLAALSTGAEQPLALGLALAGGGAAVLLVASLMRALSRLRSDGTVRIERAVGKSGTVYLTVPGQKAGVGKVTLNLQNRTVECQAVTAQDELATGAKVVVVSVIAPDTVEVVPAGDVERTSHV